MGSVTVVLFVCYSSGSCTHTQLVTGALEKLWWAVDLGNNWLITRVDITNRSDYEGNMFKCIVESVLNQLYKFQ